jgi:pimeloyl-ACP methyl ester carboxylesterase
MKASPSITTIGVAAVALFPTTATAFVSQPATAIASASSLSASLQIQEDLTFTPPDTLNDGEISEQLCTDAASKMKRVMVPVSKEVSDTGYVGISFIHWQATKKSVGAKKTLPLLLVHGFDSSALEYRRLGPQLAALGVDVYCVDLLGWGYTQLESVNSFSAKAKVEALKGFWQTVGGNGEVVVGGASLGGAATIEFAVENLCKPTDGENDGEDADQGFVRGTVLIDAQGFVDGIGPMSFLPAPLARAGIKVLKSEPLRNSANQMSYYNPETFATDDALKVGRMHCMREGWEDGMLSFMQSGGFRPKEKVPMIDVPTLVLWGRQDGILDGEEFANKFIDSMPDATLQWVEECGHVPHLEQPELTAQYISEFLRSEKVQPLRSSPSMSNGLLDGLFNFLN